MSRTYQLNTETAAAAKTVGVSQRIVEKGKYVGVFTVAEAVTSTRGTEGIEFRFKSNDGMTADYLTVWTHKENGEELMGAKLVSAIMVCVEAKSIKPAPATVRKWDRDQRKEVDVKAEVYADLMNRQIGVLLAREEYEKADGSTDWKMALVLPFDAATDRTVAEKLDRKPTGEALPAIIERLSDRPLRTGGKPAARKPASQTGGDSGGGFADMEDDIPF